MKNCRPPHKYYKKGNAMKKLLAFVTAAFLSVTVVPANAGEYDDLRARMEEARESLVTMVFHKDQRGTRQQKLVKDSADAVSAKLAKMKAPAGKAAQFNELVETWAAFKATRENDLVPAILQNDEETVRELVWGIQKERLLKCLSLSRDLDGSRIASQPSKIAEYGELRTKISAARTSLVLLMTNKSMQGAEQQKLVKDTADAVSTQLAEMKAPAGKEAQFKELVETWRAFKDTREKELVPAILKGNDEVARKISYGIQKERIAKCLALTRELDGSKMLAVSASAGEFDEFRARLSVARESLLTMLLDNSRRGADQQKLVKDSADAVSAQLAKMKAPAGKESQFRELIETWNAFKETREKELVPAILKGNDEVAKKISSGIQNERIRKCLTLARDIER
jgi:hypothetical protein